MICSIVHIESRISHTQQIVFTISTVCSKQVLFAMHKGLDKLSLGGTQPRQGLCTMCTDLEWFSSPCTGA